MSTSDVVRSDEQGSLILLPPTSRALWCYWLATSAVPSRLQSKVLLLLWFSPLLHEDFLWFLYVFLYFFIFDVAPNFLYPSGSADPSFFVSRMVIWYGDITDLLSSYTSKVQLQVGNHAWPANLMPQNITCRCGIIYSWIPYWKCINLLRKDCKNNSPALEQRVYKYHLIKI